MRESEFQHQVIVEIKRRIPGAIVLKTDPGYLQGIPDLLILTNKGWASLECKCREGAHKQPNQDYYVRRMNEMSYAAFIFPENKEEILDDIQRAFGP